MYLNDVAIFNDKVNSVARNSQGWRNFCQKGALIDEGRNID